MFPRRPYGQRYKYYRSYFAVIDKEKFQRKKYKIHHGYYGYISFIASMIFDAIFL